MTATAPALIPAQPSPGAQAASTLQPATVPTWIPTPYGALAAQVHPPYGSACLGAAILLPPIGRTAITMRPALRALADQLARRGCAVIRADWSGTGESAAPLDDDGAVPPMARRLADVAALARYAREALGQHDLILVGAGLGATLAALALGDPRGPRPDHTGATPYRCLVLLDPRAGHEPWIRLPEARPGSARGTRILLVSREEAPVEEAVEDYARRIAADRFDAVDLDALDATASESVIPTETWDIITDWLAIQTCRPTPVPMIAPVHTTTVGAGVREEYVEVGGLPGVFTYPAEAIRHSVLLVSDEGDHRGGPGGDGWVRVARAAAANGVATLRFDRSGAGEARDLGGLVGGVEETPLICATSLAEHVAAVGWLAERTGRRPAIAGHGTGAWVALAAAGRVPVRRVVSVGQTVWSTDPGRATGLGAWRFAHLPYALILRLGRTRALPTPQPLLEAATRLGAAVDLYGDARHDSAFAAVRGPEAISRLRRTGASVHRYTEPVGLDLRDPDLLNTMLGRVLARLELDLPRADDTAVDGLLSDLAQPPLAAELRRGATGQAMGGASDATDAAGRGGGRRAPGYATA